MEQSNSLEPSAAPPRPWSVGDIVACAAAILLAAIGIALDYAANHTVTPFEQVSPGEIWEAWQLFPGIVALMVAGAALRRYPDAHAVGTVLLVAGAASSAVTTLMGISSHGSVHGTPMYYVQAVGLALEPFALVGPLVLLPQVYPDGPIPQLRWRRVLNLSLILVSVATACSLLGQMVSATSGGCPADNLFCAGNLVPIVAGYGNALLIIAAVLLGLAAWLHRWRHGGRLVRRQIGLLCVALLLPLPIIGLVISVDGQVSRIGEIVLFVSWTPLVVGAIVMSILRYGLYDIRDALQRAAAYVTLTLGLVLIFLLLYLGVLALVAQASQGSAAAWVAAAAATVVALCAEPIRRKLQALVDRKLFGERGRPWRSWSGSASGSAGVTRRRSFVPSPAPSPTLSAHRTWASACNAARGSRSSSGTRN